MSPIPAGARLLAGTTCVFENVTNSGYCDGLLIDTGPDVDAYGDIAVDTLAITHGHADHFAVGGEVRSALHSKVVVARDDARLVENPEINIRGMFSWAKPGDLLVTKLFMGKACPVDELAESWNDERAQVIALPGHTLGHTGYLTRDGVLFSGDAVYQKRIWERHRLPYAIDPSLVAASLEKVLALEFEWLVPGHGEPCTRDQAESHIRFHLDQVRAIEAFLVERLRNAHTTEEAIAAVSAWRDLPDSPATYWLAVTTVKGYLGDLMSRGLVEFFVRDHAGWWRTTE